MSRDDCSSNPTGYAGSAEVGYAKKLVLLVGTTKTVEFAI
jgi:hypothetical protein